jgi:DNA-nicking Smr family endonuclease
MPLTPFRVGDRAQLAHPPHPQSDLSDKLAHAPVRMKQSDHRRLQRGKLKPEARLDLHGMTIADAHPALIGFVSDAYARGLRLLLVITGKGRGGPEADHGPIPIRRGVLRQQVPGWLNAPPLGAFVLEVREAHHRHGGAGAFYVYLKRRR